MKFLPSKHAISAVFSLLFLASVFSQTDTTYLSFQSCNPLDTGTISSVFTNQNGFDSVVIETTTLLPAPGISVISLSDYNGFEVSCSDASDGAIEITATGGEPPFSYAWSTGGGSPLLDNLSEGNYSVTVTSANGCTNSVTFGLTAPPPIFVALGDDVFIEYGEPVFLEALVSIPPNQISSVTWTGLPATACLDCLTQELQPTDSTIYTIQVVDINGCAAEDSVHVFVEKRTDFYVPNAFSPNGDGINDVFLIFAGKNVEMIEELQIYSRKGHLVYEYFSFPPNDPVFGWNGNFRDKKLNPGIYTWKAAIQFTHGEQLVTYGEFSLLR